MLKYLDLMLYAVLFYDALIVLLLPSSVTFIGGTDGSMARFSCYLTAMAIIFCSLNQYGFKRLPVISLGALLCWIVFSSFHCPNIQFDSLFSPKDPGIFNFKPMLECVLFFLLFMAAYSMPMAMSLRQKVFKTLSISGAIISVYIILQRFGMDQLYRITDQMTADHLSRNPAVGGFISQPVFAAAVLIMLLPFMAKRSIWLTILGLIAVCFTGNRSALAAIAILTVYFLLDRKVLAYALFGLYMAILAAMVAIYAWHGHDSIASSGRLQAWTLMIKDFIHPAFPGLDTSFVVTGQGIGAFSTFFPFYNQSVFYQAHNEYLELWRGCGFIGLALFIHTQFRILCQTKNRTVFASLLGICIFAATNAVWHIPVLQFLTAFLAGFGLNEYGRDNERTS